MNARKPRISLVTPSYNQAAFLETTIRSVVEQGYDNLQWGVVDGGSTDGSLEILARYRRCFDFVIVERDGGQSQAINKGLRRVEGDIVAWLNSDDTLLPGALRRVSESMGEHDWLIGAARNIDANGNTRADDPVQRAMGEFTLAGALLRRGRFNVPQPATFFSRRLLRRVGLLDESLHHCMDFDLWCRFLAAGVKPVIVNEELATYRFHETSKSVAQRERFIEALLRIEARYEPMLRWSDRLDLRRRMGYQRRALAVRRGDTGQLWRQVLRRPWWLASQQVRRALRAA